MVVYLLIAVLLLVLEWVYFKIADKFNIIDKPNLRSSHSTIVLRGGGIIFLFGAWLYAAFYGFTCPWFLLGLTMLGGISFADDIHSVSNKFRLIVHFVAMTLMFYQWGILLPEYWWVVIIALIVCTGIINAYNFMDGINGITGGYSLAVLVPLLILNSREGFVDRNFIIVALLSVLIFCFFNFRTKAKCFAGDVGSVSIAFILLYFLGSYILKSGNYWAILLLMVYGVDSVLTILHRILLHENIGKPHRKHVYQLMANELHIKHVVVSCSRENIITYTKNIYVQKLMKNMEINDKLLDELLAQAGTNERRRINLDLRNGEGDTSQRMLNALLPGTHVPIHRHTKTIETVILLRGHITELFYDEKGVECARHELNPASGIYGVQVPAGMWHTLIVHEPSVIIEMKEGAYVPITMDDIWQYE